VFESDYGVGEHCNIAFMLTHVHCKNCKTALEEKFPVFQGKIAIAFHIYFQKAQGLLRSKRPNLQESPVKQRSLTLGEVKNYWCKGVSYTIKFSTTFMVCRQI
jgi:hypothetical protein